MTLVEKAAETFNYKRSEYCVLPQDDYELLVEVIEASLTEARIETAAKMGEKSKELVAELREALGGKNRLLETMAKSEHALKEQVRLLEGRLQESSKHLFRLALVQPKGNPLREAATEFLAGLAHDKGRTD